MGEWMLGFMASPYRCRLCDHRELVLRLASPRGDEAEMEPLTAESVQGQSNADQTAPVQPSAAAELTPAFEASEAPEATPIPLAAQPPAASSGQNVLQMHNQASHSAVT